jgi:hypothetical protein
MPGDKEMEKALRTGAERAKGKLRRKDGADEIAERLFDMVRAEKPDQEVIDAIAVELRKAAQGPRKWGVLR